MLSAERIRTIVDRPPRPEGEWVLYWMTSARRRRYNAALERAVHWCRELGKPLLVLEALRAGHRYASERLHAFMLQGMADNQAAFARAPLRYYAYVEPRAGEGQGLVAALAARAALVVSDDYPAYFVPRMVASAAEQVACRFELVDTNGLWPMRATERVFTTAASFRRHLQREVLPYLLEAPKPDPLARVRLPRPPSLPRAITKRWPEASASLLRGEGLEKLDLPCEVPRAPLPGGSRAGRRQLKHFVEEGLEGYAERRNDPAREGGSGLSPYLHFGHVASHEVFAQLCEHESWTPAHIADAPVTGSREGFWSMRPGAEAFMDQLLTWREIGFNMCAHRSDAAEFDNLPNFARATLAEHASDPRDHVYELETFERAQTHDPIWNAAQRQLLGEGVIHNYLRMLWGKKILEWTASPRDALAVMLHLNDTYALDGRDPNSLSGIFWVLGRYDRAWGPERPIFGKVRYMSSASTARKLNLRTYLERWGPTTSSTS